MLTFFDLTKKSLFTTLVIAKAYFKTFTWRHSNNINLYAVLNFGRTSSHSRSFILKYVKYISYRENRAQQLRDQLPKESFSLSPLFKFRD